MKKILAFALALVMICSCLFACDIDIFNDSNSNSATSNQTSNQLDNQTDKQPEKQTEKQTENWWDKFFEDEEENKKDSDSNNPNNSDNSNDPDDIIVTDTTDDGIGDCPPIYPNNNPNNYPEFDGETLRILIRNSMPAQREWYKDITENDLDEVIALRNESVSYKLNLNVQYELIASGNYEDCINWFTAAIREDVELDLHYYDIVANYAYAGANIAVRDYIANLADKETFPYFDFTQPYWNQSIINNTFANGNLYYVTGDMNLSTFDKTMVVFLNKDMYNTMKTANDPEDLQDLAIAGDGKTGGFTYDELYRWSSVFEETNGIDGAQHDDFHAISSAYGSIPLNALPYAWDLNFVNTNSDGSHEYNIVGNTKITNAITKAQLLLCNSLAKGVSNHDNTGNCSLGGYSEPITHFAENKSIFALHLLYTSEDDNEMIREMYSEFGLLPLPKYNANQLNYGTTAHDSYTLITVIDHSESSIPTKGEAISAYLQMSNAESYTNVRGYYINRIVKPKYFGTDDTNGSVSKSIQIFNIIAENIEFDFLSVYAPQLNGVLNNCWKDVITWQNDAGALSAEEAYWADQANFDSCIAEVDRWLGIS